MTGAVVNNSGWEFVVSCLLLLVNLLVFVGWWEHRND